MRGCILVFFCKQKTAYERRISGWSAYLCSSDLMKVSVEGDRLRAIGKTLDPSIVNGESIGFLRFNARGAELFLDEIERAMKSEQGLKQWYLSAMDTNANASGAVGTLSIAGLEWCEIDFPAALRKGGAVNRGWLAGDYGNGRLVLESHTARRRFS